MNKKNKLKIIYILENKTLSFLELNQDNYDTIRLFDFLDKNFDFHIINISNIIKKDSAQIKKIGRFNFFTPTDIEDLYKFINYDSQITIYNDYPFDLTSS